MGPSMDPPKSKPPPPPNQNLDLTSRQPPPAAAAAAATRVAIAQICRSIGYTGAQPSALRALTDVATHYLQSLARSAAAAANADCRTGANVLDVALAAEEMAIGRWGFEGASEPRAPLLSSGVLKEIEAFVAAVEEEPFAKPMMMKCSAHVPAIAPMSFAQAGIEPPAPHVPRWLPCFPENWGKDERNRAAKETEKEEEVTTESNGGSSSIELRWKSEDEGGWLPAERERVKFKLRQKNRREMSLLGDRKRKHTAET